MSDKQIKIQIVGDTAQAKRDIDDLVKSTQSLPSIKIPLKTEGDSEVLKNLADIRNEAKLLQSQFQGLKVNGDVSQLNLVKTRLGEIAKDLNSVPKSLDIKAQFNAQSISSNLQKINKEVKDLQNGKVDIKAYLSGSFQGDINSIRNSINSIPRAITVGITLAGAQAALNLIGQIASSLASLGGSAIGNFLSDGYEYTKGIESSTTALTTSLQNSAKATNEANQRFNEGKGTMEDYATITGKTTESLYETVKASGGAGGATKSLKADTIGLKGELLELKKTTQEYNRDIKYEESLKKELEKTTKYLVQGYKSQIDSIQDVILGMENQEKASLVRTNSTDREIKDIERLIKTKQLEIDIDEKKLDKDKSKQEKSFDKNNKPVLDDIAKKEIQLDKKSLEIQKRKNLLDNNPTANAGALAQIKNEEEAIREQTSALRIQKDEIRLKRQELVLNIENQQENQRNLIENKKEELDKNKEIADAKKNQNEAIKNQFEVQIDDQKKLIDGLKDKIEKANIKLDLDTKPIQDKIDSIKQKITDLQEQSQDIQTEISDRQQAASEANTGGGGGGGGGGKVSVPLVDIKDINAQKQGKGFDEVSESDVRKRIDRVIGESTAFAIKTPFEKKDVIAISAQLEALKFNTLAGVEDKEKGTKGSKDIFGAGYNNILNIASDFIARKLQTDGGGSSQQATKDFTRAITYLQTGNTKSFTQFGVTGDQLLASANSLGLNLEKQKDLAKLSTEQITQILANVAEKKLIKGSAAAQSETLQGLESNAKDAFNGLYEEFFGKPSDPKSLAGSIKESIKSFTDILSGPDSSELKKSFKELGTSLGTLLKQLITPENLKATFDGLKSVVDGMKGYLTPDNIKSFASAIGDFVKGIPGILKTVGEILEDIAARFGIKTEKIRTQETKDYFGSPLKSLNPFDEKNGLTQGIIDKSKIDKLDQARKDGFSDREIGITMNIEEIEKTRKTYNEQLNLFNQDLQKSTNENNKIFAEGQKKNAESVVEFASKGIKSIKDFTENGKVNTESLSQYWSEKITGMISNVDKIVTEGSQKFVQFKDGTKISLDSLGADFANLTDIQIIEKLKTLPGAFSEAFKTGKDLSEEQLKTLSSVTGISVESLKTEFAKLKEGIANPINEGTKQAKESQNELLENSQKTGEGIQKSLNNLNLDGAKQEISSFDRFLQDLVVSAKNAANWLVNLGREKNAVNKIPEPSVPVSGKGSSERVGFAVGGLITGGSGVRDDVPLMAMGGEYVLKKSAVNRYGLDILNQINEGKFNLNKIETIRIPTVPSPKITNNNQNNQNNQAIQNINNTFNIPNNGGLDLKLKTSLSLFSDNLTRSASSGLANISV